MVKWRVDRQWIATGPSPPSRDTEAQFAFMLTSDGQERQVTVEFVRGADGSPAAARGVLNRYLNTDAPPRFLIMDSEGRVSTSDQ
jgi:hypothetical protein